MMNVRLVVMRDGEVVSDHRTLTSREIRQVGDEGWEIYHRCLNELKRRGEW